MNILITGGAGRVGQPLGKFLAARGYNISAIDNHPAENTEFPCAVCDINNIESIRPHLADIDAIVHLAGIPSPSYAPDEVIFQVNCSGTYNIYQAAEEAGIKRIVSASSINAFGFNFGLRNFPIQALPIDETHSGVTTDSYSFSKLMLEQIAEYFWRRSGIVSACMRFTGVTGRIYSDPPRKPGISRTGDDWATFRAYCRDRVLSIISLEPEQRKKTVQDLWEDVDKHRSFRPTEEMSRDWWRNKYFLHVITDFWTRVHISDVGDAVEQALVRPLQGAEAFFICDSRNILGVETDTLAKTFFPETPHLRPLIGDESIVSIDKARRMLGFEPQCHFGESTDQ